KTLRFATIVLAPLRLRCCDINLEMNAKTNAFVPIFKQTFAVASQLIAEHDISAAGGDLMVNVKALGQQFLPMTDALLVDYEINSFGIAPSAQHGIFADRNVAAVAGTNVHFVV